MFRTSSLLRSLLLHCLCGVFAGSVATAATLPPGFTESQIAGGLRRPTAMAFAPDGRLFICEQGGTLRVVKNGALLSTPFVTLTVSSIGERGLLGIAFDPEFAENNFVYLYYTATTPTVHNRLSRFTANGDVAVAGSELAILDLETLSATNHNGGAIHFGLDGRLYVGVGENAVGSNAQSLNNRLGKILRINSDGSIPPDNPFFTIATGLNRSIWALGLRNPFTFAIDPLAGRMFINDVGQNTWEEINEGVAGANYGWPATEGPTSDPRFRTPIYAYDHDNGCAIAGGAFITPIAPQFPLPYWDAYFFADLCGGWIRSRHTDGTVTEFASDIIEPVDLQLAADGSLYYLARGGGAATGVVFRVVYNSVPTVDFTANGEDGPVTLPPGSALEIQWSFDAGPGGPLPAAEIYLLLVTPFGTLWADPAQGWVSTPTRAYAGPIGTFAPSTLFDLPQLELPPGRYWWVVVVDDDQNGVPNGDMSDFVLTIVP